MKDFIQRGKEAHEGTGKRLCVYQGCIHGFTRQVFIKSVPLLLNLMVLVLADDFDSLKTMLSLGTEDNGIERFSDFQIFQN